MLYRHQHFRLSIPQSKSIINALDWINHHTPTGCSIIIDKNWRGWTELQLKGRSFQFYEKANTGRQGDCVLGLSGKPAPNNIGAMRLIYNNGDFSVYKLDYGGIVEK